MRTCDNCGGIVGDVGEMIAGTPCKCGFAAARGWDALVAKLEAEILETDVAMHRASAATKWGTYERCGGRKDGLLQAVQFVREVRPNASDQRPGPR